MIVTHSTGNNAGNIHFVWHVPSTEPLETTIDRSQAVIEEIKPSFPVYHTRAMHTEIKCTASLALYHLVLSLLSYVTSIAV